MSHNHHHLQLPGSPLSPLSPPSPFQPNGGGTSSSFSSTADSKTIYDVIYSTDNPPEFYGIEGHLQKTGACPHLVQLKQKIKEDQEEEDILENYRSLVRYSILWHKSRKLKAEAAPTVGSGVTTATNKKRKQLKEVGICFFD